MGQPPDVSMIVNLHREGALCWPTLKSARLAVETACGAGVACELILVLDACDEATARTARKFSDFARVEQADLGDLGAARNHGIAAATGRFIAFLDGDDLCCRQWLIRALAEINTIASSAIVHPQLNLFFGRKYNHYYWSHPDMRFDDVTLGRLLVENLWTSSVFASRKTFEMFPYIRNRIDEGFGFEDWVWNVATAAQGLPHIVAPDTIHFIRRKTDSLVSLSSRAKVIPDFRSALDPAAPPPEGLSQPLGRRDPVFASSQDPKRRLSLT